MTSKWLLLTLVGLLGCGAKWSSNDPGTNSSGSTLPAGTATIDGSLTGLDLASGAGISIARTNLPTLEIKVAPSNLACGTTLDADRLTIDVGAVQAGTFTVVKGYPASSSLASFQARAHACPGGNDAAPGTCHDQVIKGTVTLTKVDDPGGFVDGTFDVTFSDGQVTGDFHARRCD